MELFGSRKSNAINPAFITFMATNENTLKTFQFVYLEMLELQRKALLTMNNKTEYDEELIRKYLSLIDMEEFKIREKLVEETS